MSSSRPAVDHNVFDGAQSNTSHKSDFRFITLLLALGSRTQNTRPARIWFFFGLGDHGTNHANLTLSHTSTHWSCRLLLFRWLRLKMVPTHFIALVASPPHLVVPQSILPQHRRIPFRHSKSVFASLADVIPGSSAKPRVTIASYSQAVKLPTHAYSRPTCSFRHSKSVFASLVNLIPGSAKPRVIIASCSQAVKPTTDLHRSQTSTSRQDSRSSSLICGGQTQSSYARSLALRILYLSVQ
ncbi:hypothetical protein K438DRAFT_1219903 [Mycena galopus ATCC 62051]|nr:hypothetical protein K438DRAFT_1219903 [Mycena galopus ATCC 62051]